MNRHDRLHLGCGTNVLTGWLNLDVEPGPGVLVHDLTTPLPFADASMRFVYSEHFIEHVPQSVALRILQECFRVLVPGGRLRLSTPDLSFMTACFRQAHLTEWADVDYQPASTADLLNGGMRLWGHQYVYDSPALERLVGAAGFTRLERVRWRDSAHPELRGLECRPFHHEIIIEAIRPTAGTAREPRVSVVMAAYNHRAFVGECVRSVLEQDFTDLEFLITDDGSSDGTPDVIAQFSDPRIHLERFARNQGACRAINAAIRRARGEYIAVINSDDLYLPHKLMRQVQHLDSNPGIGAVFTWPRFIDEHGAKVPGGPMQVMLQGNRSPAEWVRFFFFQGNCLCHPSVLIRRECYTRLGLYDVRFRQLPDFHMWIRLLGAYRFHIMTEELMAFRVLAGGRNESAPRADTLLRHAWEEVYVSEAFTSLPTPLLEAAFAPERAELVKSAPSREHLLVYAAIKSGKASNMVFGMNLLANSIPPNGAEIDHLGSRLMMNLTSVLQYQLHSTQHLREMTTRFASTLG